jgi:hypothetical protein
VVINSARRAAMPEVFMSPHPKRSGSQPLPSYPAVAGPHMVVTRYLWNNTPDG